MFLGVGVVLPEQEEVVAVPATAVVHASYGDSVFVAVDKQGEDGRARKVAQQKFVKTGDARGDFVAIQSGVQAGEEVVVAGSFKLRNGLPLTIDNGHAGEQPKLAPNPPNR
jgi:membrane fusion protein (multidrug efflux system)